MGEGLSLGPGFGQLFLALLFEFGQAVVGHLDLIQLVLTACQVLQHLRNRAAVLLFEPVQVVQAGLDGIQFLGRKIQTLSHVPKALRHVFCGVAKF